jgi:hypothetical protein
MDKGSLVHFLGTYLLKGMTDDVARNTMLFVATVPAGDYRFEEIPALGVGLQLGKLDKVGIPPFGTFRILPGKVQDLGRLIIASDAAGHYRMDRGHTALTNSDLLKRVSPENEALIAGPPVDGWLEPASVGTLQAHAEDNPFSFSDAVALRNGEMAMAGGMGIVRIRSANGAWRTLKSPYKESFLTIAPGGSDDTLAIVAGELDTLARVDPAGQITRIDPGDLPKGNIVFVDGQSKAGWYAVLENNHDIGIYHADRIDSGNWTKVRSERQDRWSDIVTSFWVWPEPHGFAYALSSGWIRSLDFATGQWSETTSPNRNTIHSMLSTPEGWGVLCSNSQTSPDASGKHAYGNGYFLHSYYSNDRGQNWHEVNRPEKYLTSAPVPTEAGLLSTGGKEGIATTWLSSDGGSTWLPSTAIYRYARISEVPLHGLFAVTPDAVLRLDLPSQTWKTEFQSQ